MNRHYQMRVCAITAVLIVSLTSMCWCGQAYAGDGDSPETKSINIAIPVGDYEITSSQQGQEVSVEGYGSLLVPGKPKLPSIIMAIAIPPGAVYDGVDFDLGKGVALTGTYEILPAPLPRVIGEEDPVLRQRDLQRYERNFKEAYESDNAYPANVVEFVRTAGYRRYNLVDVRIAPVQYHPVSGRLIFYPNIKVDVRYSLSAAPRSVMVDFLPRTERVAEGIVANYDQAGAWYAAPRDGGRGLHDFVIITLDSLTSSVTPLVNAETSKGRNVQVVTTSWINSNYPGGYDLAENIRNFLRDKYPSGEWGIEDVLIVGHYDNVPMRRCAQDVGYGQPETDFYYAELSLPDDQSWDDDWDHQYGEDSDSIDFYAEVNVGRIPWSSPATVQSICEKSVAYEQNTDPAFKKNILLLGSYFWEDTDNAQLMEAKVNPAWMSDWTMTRMYEQNSTVYSIFPCDLPISHANVMSVWPSGQFAFVNWAGHGSPTSTHMMGYSSQAFIRSSDCSSLNDNYPAIIFADACSNSDTDEVNIGQSMLEQGAVGFVGATKVAFGSRGWNDPYDGSGQSMDYFFTTSVTSGLYTQGEAHQRALREMYTNGLWYYPYYETFEWGALWGNPCLSMGAVTPPNDDCAFASEVGNGAFTGSTRYASNDGSASCGSSSSSPDVWFAFPTGPSGTLTAETCDASFDSVLSIYSGTCGGLTEIACNDNSDNCGTGSDQSSVSAAVSEETTYLIRVSGRDGDAGEFTLSIDGPIVDFVTPFPDPPDWTMMPTAISTTEVQMEAWAEDADTPPVEYRFEPYSLGHARDWSTDATYTDTGLPANSLIAYYLRARDSSPAQNETGYSLRGVYTFIETPAQLTDTLIDDTFIEVFTAPPAGGSFSKLNLGDSGLFFEVTTTGGTPIGGGDANTWVQYPSQSIIATGLSPNTTYRFRVRARNQNNASTGWYPAEDPDPQYVEYTTTGSSPTCGNTFGDINGDTYINGDDIGGFVRAKLELPAELGEDQYCAHLDGNLDQEDIEDFIVLLLN